MLHVLTHSFPTRRSSVLLGDHLVGGVDCAGAPNLRYRLHFGHGSEELHPDRRRLQTQQGVQLIDQLWEVVDLRVLGRDVIHTNNGHPAPPRSEEHTSELQSLMRISYAVFCLKKKN